MSHHHHHHSDVNEKSFKEKLKILLHHWKEHNNSHLEEYKKWKEKVAEEGMLDVEELMKEVCEKVSDIGKLYDEIEKML